MSVVPSPESRAGTGPVRADYAGACVANLIPALLRSDERAARADWLPPAVAGARVVVVLVLDGLGWDAREAHADRMPNLAGMAGRPITTVVPSTTAAALTSITTGLAPAEHGVVGYRVFHDGDVVNVVSWQRANGKRPPDPVAFQRRQPFLGRRVPVVTESRHRTSGFTQVHLRDAPFSGWRVTSELVEHLRRLTRGAEADRPRLLYAYYPGLDEVAHAHGLHDGFYTAELAALDRLVGDVLDALLPDTALVVTADHGQAHVGPEGWQSLGPLLPLVGAMSGDGRFRSLHARSGAAGDLLARAEAEYGTSAWVFDRARLLDEGWLGPEVGAVARRRVGDVILAAKGSAAFADPDFIRETELISAHGSLTPAEMWVPCLGGRGRATDR